MQGPKGLPLQRVWNGVQGQEKVSEARSQLQRDALLQEVSKIFQNKNLDSQALMFKIRYLIVSLNIKQNLRKIRVECVNSTIQSTLNYNFC